MDRATAIVINKHVDNLEAVRFCPEDGISKIISIRYVTCLQDLLGPDFIVQIDLPGEEGSITKRLEGMINALLDKLRDQIRCGLLAGETVGNASENAYVILKPFEEYFSSISAKNITVRKSTSDEHLVKFEDFSVKDIGILTDHAGNPSPDDFAFIVWSMFLPEKQVKSA